jgi:hypothetical protein
MASELPYFGPHKRPGWSTDADPPSPQPLLWEYAPVNAEDDPEARIRALEQPLSDQARASELGGGQADYSTPAYGTQPYGAQPFGTQPYVSQQQYGGAPYDSQQYGAQPYGTSYGGPAKKVSGGIPWLVFGLIAVVFIAVAAGAIIFMTRMTGVTTPDDSSVSSGGGSIDISIPAGPSIPSVEIPDVPSVPDIPTPGLPDTEPSVISGAPGQTVTVSGIDEIRTVTCNDATVTVSGIRNTVNIVGHCAAVTVSGIENTITVDAADSIGASGFDNKITYRSGTPQIDATDSNTVQLG